MRGWLLVASLTAVCVVLAGCAATPESIAPSYVSVMAYQNWTCEQLGAEEGRLQSAYVLAAGQQNDARTTDTVGVVLLGLPVGSMTGENVAPQVASLKGQMQAVQQTETLHNCGQLSETSEGAANTQNMQSFNGFTKKPHS